MCIHCTSGSFHFELVPFVRLPIDGGPCVLLPRLWGENSIYPHDSLQESSTHLSLSRTDYDVNGVCFMKLKLAALVLSPVDK